MKKQFFILLLIIVPLFINGIQASESNAKLELLKKEHYETDSAIINLKRPQVINVKDERVKNCIDKLINQTINDFLNELSDCDQEHKTIAEITYQNYYSDDQLFSFSINFTQIMADSYLQKKFYTINLATGEVYNVEHFLGSDYQNIIKSTVQQQVKESIDKYPNLSYFNDEINNLTINIDQPFYLNKDKQVVIVFNQFQIAPGYMSLPEFIIKS